MSATSPQPRVPTEEIAGLVERVTFFNPENGFAVLRVQVRGEREPVTILGSLWGAGDRESTEEPWPSHGGETSRIAGEVDLFRG
jgi:hypothetical protein